MSRKEVAKELGGHLGEAMAEICEPFQIACEEIERLRGDLKKVQDDALAYYSEQHDKWCPSPREKELLEDLQYFRTTNTELEARVKRYKEALEDVRDEHVISVGKSETVQWKMLAMARANIAIEALEGEPKADSEGA